MECTHSSDTRVQWSCDIAFLSPFHHSPSFSSFYYFNSDFWYIDMHPTLAGLYPFLLGSPARCTFLSYFMFIYMFRSPARSRLSRSTVALTHRWSTERQGKYSMMRCCFLVLCFVFDLISFVLATPGCILSCSLVADNDKNIEIANPKSDYSWQGSSLEASHPPHIWIQRDVWWCRRFRWRQGWPGQYLPYVHFHVFTRF